MARVVFTKKAREDLIDIWLHIAEDDPAAADRVLDRLDEAASLLADHPEMGAARDDIRPGLRYLISGSSYDDCPAGIVSPAILKAGKSSKTQPFFSVS